MGETVPYCLEVLKDNGADIVGSNCSHGSPVFIELARLLRDNTDLPVIVQPNRGKPMLEKETMVYKQTVEEFVTDARTIAGVGVNVFGGCCGTTPEFIAGVRRELEPRARAAVTRQGAP